MLVDSLRTEQAEGKTNLYLDDLLIAVYSTVIIEPSDDQKRIDMMQDYGFPGYLLLSASFFRRFHLEKPPNSQSQMKNVAKAFFIYNEKNHACLVQYLHPNGSSSEHYHSLEEHIVSLAGNIHVCMRPVEEGECNTVELTEGRVLVIPPKTWHKVLIYDVGSVTVPIKQTIKGKKDHFYA